MPAGRVDDEAQRSGMQDFAALRLEASSAAIFTSRICWAVISRPPMRKLGAHHVRAQVRPRNTEHHIGDPHVGCTLGLLDRKADGAFQVVKIDNGARTDALGSLRACAGHARFAIRRIAAAGNQAGDLR